MITVKQLIEKLQKFDGNLPVLLYDAYEESSTVVDDVEIEEGEDFHYNKEDHAFFYNRTLRKNPRAVTIVGNSFTQWYNYFIENEEM